MSRRVTHTGTLICALPVVAVLLGCSTDSTLSGPRDAESAPPRVVNVAGTSSAHLQDDWFVDHATFAGLNFLHFNGMSGEFYFPEMIPPGAGLLDYDNDGDLDLYVANGHVLDKIALFQSGVEYMQEHQLFRNQGDGRFAEVGTVAGEWFLHKQISRAAAFGDYDGDGDVDVLVANCGGVARLVRNEGGNQENWLMVQTVGTRSNRDGVGAIVRVVAEELEQIRQVRSGSSYLAASDMRLHFGLGFRARADLVEVKWPSGVVQQLEQVAANQVLVIKENGG